MTHWVQSVRTPVNQFLHKLRDLRSSGPLLGQRVDLSLCRDLASEEEPEKTLGKGLRAPRSGRELFLAFGDGEASESDTFLGVEDGPFPDQALYRLSSDDRP